VTCPEGVNLFPRGYATEMRNCILTLLTATALEVAAKWLSHSGGQGYRIVASVGDQYSDLAGGHEAAAFKLPNPFYFLP
jgi:hypothetical protein